MGQMALGILYGCESPIKVDPEDLHGIVDAFNIYAKIDRYSDTPRVRVEHESDKTLIGVWVAVGGSGEDGCPYFADISMPVDQIGAVYSTSAGRAKKLWDRFAKYVHENHNTELPVATLWITPCEVA